MTLEGAFATVGSGGTWPVVPFEAVLSQRKEVGREDLPTLGVSLARGVTTRQADDGRPAASLDQSNYKVVYPGDIIMNALGKPHGSIGVSTELGITSPAYWVLKVDPQQGEPRFFHYLLRSDHAINEYKRLGKYLPPNQFDLSWELFRNIEFPLPPIEEQRRIADFLDDQVGRIDQAIALRKRQSKALQEAQSARVTDAFFGSSRVVRTPFIQSSAFIPRLRESQSWRFAPLGRLTRRSRIDSRGELEPLSVYLNLGVIPRSSREDNKNELGADLDKYLHVLPGDLVFNKLRTWQGGFGASELEGIVSPAYYVLRPSSLVNAKFLRYQLLTTPYLAELTRLSKFMPPSQFDMSWDDLKMVKLGVPSLEDQLSLVEAIERDAADVTAILEQNELFMANLKDRRTALITAAVTGQLDVTASLPLTGPWVSTGLSTSVQSPIQAAGVAL